EFRRLLRLKELKRKGRRAARSPSCDMIAGDFRKADLPDHTFDAIVTDPPYPERFLSLYDDLGLFAARVLKPGGSLVCLTGHIHLPDVMVALGRHLRYHWLVAYLTPGGQSAQIFPRKVNPFWKPVLWYVNGDYDGPWVGDVVNSDVNDND